LTEHFLKAGLLMEVTCGMEQEKESDRDSTLLERDCSSLYCGRFVKWQLGAF